MHHVTFPVRPVLFVLGEQGITQTKLNTMIVTITTEANNQSELIEHLDQIRNEISSNTLDHHELMDGSYQIGEANIELELV